MARLLLIARVAAFWAAIPASLAAGAAPPAPFARASLASPGPAMAGQKVTLAVELLAPGFFASAASFDIPDAPALLIMPPTGSPVVSSETVDGTAFTIQRHELAIFARRAGLAEIPAITARFSYKASPLDATESTATVATKAVQLEAKAPPGAEGLGDVISARGLTVAESWKPDIGDGRTKVGAALTRTVTFSAPDVPAMLFPPFPAGEIAGVGIYPKDPVVADSSERGQSRGERRDSITYVCERAGEFTIPAARFTWYDLESSQLQSHAFPAHVLRVEASQAFRTLGSTPGDALKPQGLPSWRSILIVAAWACLAAFIAWWARRRGIPSRVLANFAPVHLQPLNPTSHPAANKHVTSRKAVK